MKVLGLTGNAGAGKDYLYKVIKEELDGTTGEAVERVAFADGVRYEIADVLGIDNPLALWAKPYPVEIRKLLQWWGTELRRAEDEDYWIKHAISRMEVVSEHADLIVVTDVRFENEAAAIRDLGGIVVEVYADPKIRAERLGGQLPPNHASEVIDFRTDAVVVNNIRPTLPDVLAEFLWPPTFAVDWN